MSEVLEGYVEKIVFRNADNGYTVFQLQNEDDDVICVGSISFLNEGEYVQLSGEYTSHPMYGEQFKVTECEIKEPEDAIAMERYLASGAIKGIGPALAARIVNKFKQDTFRIMEEEPECLAKIKGISEKKAREIAEQFEEKRELRNAMIFLQKYGISTYLAVKIYKEYGMGMYRIIQENPYRLAEDIHGIGFRLSDEIAEKVGIMPESEFRIQAAMLYVLQQAGGSGHTYLPMEELFRQTAELTSLSISQMEHPLTDMMVKKTVVVKELDGIKRVYYSGFYYTELNVARKLLDLNVSYPVKETEIERRMESIEREVAILLDDQQKKAVLEAAKNGLLVITGGPGTGKTTTINTILRFFESEGMDILLAAPTGRAAKRMKETTGYEARTIHRMLELNGEVTGEQERDRMKFERNEENPLEADVIIIDEMSMVDINLMHALLKAIMVGTRLILVGDVNQLPSVGPGNVLRDIIDSQSFSMVELTKIFRQATESDIIVNAHKINHGENITLDNNSKDFFFLNRADVGIIWKIILRLVQEKLPKYVQSSRYDIQVLTPMRKGELGVERLNQILQKYLNPPAEDKHEKETSTGVFREGDKVMQIRNNYQLPWEIKTSYGTPVEEGCGVFNGDAGIIREINQFAETLTVEYEEGKKVSYSFNMLDELELAYAITIHKAQGSEYPAVVMPILTGPKMLFNRNLLYTAVTRAKKCVTIVGSQEMVDFMIHNVSEQKRYSGLKESIREMKFG